MAEEIWHAARLIPTSGIRGPDGGLTVSNETASTPGAP
jgi:hypothetical protein